MLLRTQAVWIYKKVTTIFSMVLINSTPNVPSADSGCTKGSTKMFSIKQIGSGIKTAETRGLGIAVTFQACLQLENDGRVVLSQA